MGHLLEDARPAPLGRHLAALLYDAFLIGALFMLCGFIFVMANGGEALAPGSLRLQLFRLCLLLLWGGFYVYFWTAQAQTLGMRAWRLVLVNAAGQNLRAGQAWKRFFLALGTLGLGLLWRLLDADGRTLYDRWAGTRLLQVPRNPYSES